jgi:predicted nucleic acid-binding protein
MPKVLFDTDIIIDFLRGIIGAKKIMASIKDDDMPCCSVITVAEIRAGMREIEEHATMSLLGSLDVLTIDTNIAQLAGDLKRKTRQQQLALDDCFIAATAIIHQAILITHNPKHYPHKDLMLKKAIY